MSYSILPKMVINPLKLWILKGELMGFLRAADQSPMPVRLLQSKSRRKSFIFGSNIRFTKMELEKSGFTVRAIYWFWYYHTSNQMILFLNLFIIGLNMSQILYHDAQVTVYKELILIKKYYFPLATSKTILFQEIERVALMDSEGVTHRWGVCGKYLNNWFPLDSDRKNKTKFIEITLKGRKTRPSITPDDPDKVFRIIWENHTPEGKEYVEKMSEQVGKETEVAQQELMEREKQGLEIEVSEQQLTVSKIKQQKVEK